MIYLGHSISKHGDLVIKLHRESKAELKELSQEEGWQGDAVMGDIFENLLCNSEYSWVRPEEIAALTNAPILGIRGEDGESVEQVWWYPSYQLRSPQQDLLEYGEVIFQKGD